MSSLILRNIDKSFGTNRVLEDVSLEVEDGEFVVFVGPSGCGKSTLLRIIAGLDQATDGDILLDGQRVNAVPAADRGLAMVFQSYALYPHMTVRQNLSFGLENSRMPRAEVRALVDDAARMLRIEPLLQRRPRQLSGGQRQRVAIGRAIVRRPGIFLLDEPLSNLDAELRVAMRGELAGLHERLRATMIYVTHDQVEAMTMADRIVVLRDGRIFQIGSPLELYNRPANRFVAGFLGAPRMNFLPATLVGRAKDGLDLALADGSRLTAPVDPGFARQGSALTVGVRPQHLALTDGDGPAVAVALVEQLGNETILYGRSDALGDLTLALAGQVAVTAGTVVHLAIDPALVHVFGEDDQALSPLPRAA